MLDACRIVTLAGDTPGEVRRRVQQNTTRHRGRKGGIPSTTSGFSCAPHVIGSRSINKNASVRPSRQMRHRICVAVAYHCAQHVRDAFHQPTPAHGRRLATRLVERLPTCPIPEIARLGRTLRRWKDAFLAYFDTAGASNAPHRSHQRTLSNEADAPPEATATPPTTSSECSSSQERPRCLHPHSTLKSQLMLHETNAEHHRSLAQFINLEECSQARRLSAFVQASVAALAIEIIS